MSLGHVKSVAYSDKYADLSPDVPLSFWHIIVLIVQLSALLLQF